MTTFLYIAALVALLCVILVGLDRERNRGKAAVALHSELIEAHGLDEAYISEYGGSLIGLSRAPGVLVLGTLAAPRRFPFNAIRSIEGLRDDVVMVRADREAAVAPTQVAEQDDLPPQAIRTLALRITVDDPEPMTHSVLFLDAGRQGLEAHNVHLRDQAALTEAWYRKVVEAMRG